MMVLRSFIPVELKNDLLFVNDSDMLLKSYNCNNKLHYISDTFTPTSYLQVPQFMSIAIFHLSTIE